MTPTSQKVCSLCKRFTLPETRRDSVWVSEANPHSLASIDADRGLRSHYNVANGGRIPTHSTLRGRNVLLVKQGSDGTPSHSVLSQLNKPRHESIGKDFGSTQLNSL